MSASLRDEAVAGVVIVCPSTQQPCGYPTSVKRYGGATRRRWRRFPGQLRPLRRSAAMRAVATKSLVIWPRAYWPKGCFFGHWRSGTTFSLVTGDATRRAVRKHRAPKGALRHDKFLVVILRSRRVRKHRAPKGALRLDGEPDHFPEEGVCQKAPSTKRCIKTYPPSSFSSSASTAVRKHRAPKGALRRVEPHLVDKLLVQSESTERQKVH